MTGRDELITLIAAILGGYLSNPESSDNREILIDCSIKLAKDVLIEIDTREEEAFEAKAAMTYNSEFRITDEQYWREKNATDARIAQLKEGLIDAIECVEEWSTYASEYFQNKHDLAGDIARLKSYLEDK